MLEGDSANVWQRIFEDKGNSARALAYIVENGSFECDADSESRIALDGFLRLLRDANLLAESSHSVDIRKQQRVSTTTTRETDAVSENAESLISQFMADNHIFYNLTLELTYRCNERCIHCYCPDNRKTDELSTAQIATLLDEFQSVGGLSLLITGGEIFARKDIKAILRDLRNRNLIVNVISNLTIADEEDLDLLTNLNPRSVGCSIYSADPHIHDNVTLIPGSWARSMASIQSLRGRGIPVTLKAPLMQSNIHGWRDIEDLAEKIGCGMQFDVCITPKNDGGQSPIDLRVKDRAILEDLFSSRFSRLYQNNEPLTISAEEQRQQASLCGAGATGLAVGPDGTVRACIGLMNKIGQWPRQSLREIWEESTFFGEWAKQRLMDLEKCSSCKQYSFCNRCPGSWQLETGSVTKPADYTCYIAEILSGCSKQNLF
jgi:radical SAM protein with 4Fe4S-binding SPASM domain